MGSVYTSYQADLSSINGTHNNLYGRNFVIDVQSRLHDFVDVIAFINNSVLQREKVAIAKALKLIKHIKCSPVERQSFKKELCKKEQ